MVKHGIGLRVTAAGLPRGMDNWLLKSLCVIWLDACFLVSVGVILGRLLTRRRALTSPVGADPLPRLSLAAFTASLLQRWRPARPPSLNWEFGICVIDSSVSGFSCLMARRFPVKRC